MWGSLYIKFYGWRKKFVEIPHSPFLVLSTQLAQVPKVIAVSHRKAKGQVVSPFT